MAANGRRLAARLISGLLVRRVKHGGCPLGASTHFYSAALRYTLSRHGACVPRHLSHLRLALPAARLLLLLLLLHLLHLLQVLLLLLRIGLILRRLVRLRLLLRIGLVLRRLVRLLLLLLRLLCIRRCVLPSCGLILLRAPFSRYQGVLATPGYSCLQARKLAGPHTCAAVPVNYY